MEKAVPAVGEAVLSSASQRASSLFSNLRAPHARFFGAMLLAHSYLALEVFSRENFNSACSKFLPQKHALCFPFVNERMFSLIPEAAILGTVAYASYVAAPKLREQYAGNYPGSRLHWVMGSYLALRAASLSAHGNFLDFFHQHFLDVGKAAAVAIPLAYALMLSSPGSGGVPVHLDTPKTDAAKDAKRDKYRNSVISNVKHVFPKILEDIAYNNFQQITVSKDGVRVPNAMAISSVQFLNDKEVFVELKLIPQFIADISRLKSFDWKTGIEARGKIDRLVSAWWMSSGGRNGVVLEIEEETIDFSAKFDYPSLLVPNPNLKSPLDFVVGVDARGDIPVTNLAKLPHLLAAGTSGGGKSVGMNNILVSLMKNRLAGHDIEFTIVDPKKVEFGAFKGLPGFNVITDLSEAVQDLKRIVEEMDHRYAVFERLGYKNIGEYHASGGHMPHMVVIVDEFADIMTQGGDMAKEFEYCVVRFAQLARAAGIHLILATQNPVAEVLTTNIKANLPSRLWFRTVDGIKSTTIFDDPRLKDINHSWESWLRADGGSLHHLKTFFINPKEFREFIEYYKRESFRGVPVHLDSEKTEETAGPNAYAVLNEFDAYARKQGLPFEKYSGAYSIFRHLVTNKGYKGRNELHGIVSSTSVTQAQIGELIPVLRDNGLVRYDEKGKRNYLAHQGEAPDMEFLALLYSSIRSVIQG